MNPDTRNPQYPYRRLKRYAWALVFLWSGAVAVSLLWSGIQERENAIATAKKAARDLAQREAAHLTWYASHGGFYVPLDTGDGAVPGPPVNRPRKPGKSNAGGLSLLTCETISREIHGLLEGSGSIRVRATSFDPRNATNQPDAWEARGLDALVKGEAEVCSVEKLNGIPLFRLIRPLAAEESCLSCHVDRGLAPGDMLGAISVAVPLQGYVSGTRSRIAAVAMRHGLLWLLGMGIIYVGLVRLTQQALVYDRTEEALFESELKFRHIYANAPVMMQVVNSEGRVSDVNQAWVNALGYARDEIVGTGANSVMTADSAQDALPGLVPKEDSAGETGTFQATYRRKDGSVMDVILDCHYTTDPSGAPMNLTVVRDVTAQKHSEIERKVFARLGARLAGATSLEMIFAIVRAESRHLLDWDAHRFRIGRPQSNENRLMSSTIMTGGEEDILRTGDWDPADLIDEARATLEGHCVLIARDPGDAERYPSEIYVPIKRGNDVTGILSVHSRTVRRYGEGEVQILQRIADVVSPALERLHTEEALREQNDTLSLLNLVARITTASLTPEAMCDQLVEFVRGAMACDAFFIDMYDSETGEARMIRAHDTLEGRFVPVKTSDTPFQPEKRVLDRVLRERKPLLIHRKEGDDDVARLRPFGDDSRPSASLLFVPMEAGNRVIGLMSAQTYTREAYSPKDMDLLEAIARQAGPALEAALLAEQLRESEERFRTVVETAADSIFMKDTDLRYTMGNPAMARLFGVDPKELVGRRDVEIFGEEAGRHIEDVDRRVLQGETVSEQHAKPIDSRMHTFHVVKVPLRDRDGNVIGLCGIARDVTERQNLEDQLRQAAKMEAVGKLAGGIAHDFNNLIQGILGYASLIKVNTPPGDKVHQASDVIEKTAERASELTNQLLGFARRGRAQNTRVDLHETIRDVVRLLSRTVEKNILIVEKLRAAKPCVQGDSGQMQQVILNLAINARDAMPEGGELVIETAVVPLDHTFCRIHTGSPPGEYVQISVSDTGPGIPEKIRERIFEPFFTTKDSGTGTGMGLAMVYGIVRNHGGTVLVDSTPGEGSTFTVYLPLARGTAKQTPARKPARPIRGSGRILVVDDEEVVRNAAAAMLAGLGYEVLTASDGVEGVDVYRKRGKEIDVVLIDLVMPRMGGRDCLRKLKEINPGVRAVLSTGYGLDDSVQRILDEGTAGFVQKPYRLEQLSKVIAEARNGGNHGSG